jgi:hypothetical protein
MTDAVDRKLDPLITDELATKLNSFFGDLGLQLPDAQHVAGVLRARGIGLLDVERHRAMVDEKVYAGACWRANHWRVLAEAREPVPMILFCPACGSRHIDQANPENGWLNPPHRSHLCAACGHIWRPADIPTAGVAAIATRGRRDVGPLGEAARAARDCDGPSHSENVSKTTVQAGPATGQALEDPARAPAESAGAGDAA